MTAWTALSLAHTATAVLVEDVPRLASGSGGTLTVAGLAVLFLIPWAVLPFTLAATCPGVVKLVTLTRDLGCSSLTTARLAVLFLIVGTALLLTLAATCPGVVKLLTLTRDLGCSSLASTGPTIQLLWRCTPE